MAKKAAKKKADKKLKGGTGEQQELIDTTPKNVKPLIKKARQWRSTIEERLSLQETEADQKAELRELVANSGLTPLDNGDIVFKHEGVHIVVKPMQDGKISVAIDEGE